MIHNHIGTKYDIKHTHNNTFKMCLFILLTTLKNLLILQKCIHIYIFFCEQY